MSTTQTTRASHLQRLESVFIDGGDGCRGDCDLGKVGPSACAATTGGTHYFEGARDGPLLKDNVAAAAALGQVLRQAVRLVGALKSPREDAIKCHCLDDIAAVRGRVLPVARAAGRVYATGALVWGRGAGDWQNQKYAKIKIDVGYLGSAQRRREVADRAKKTAYCIR